MEQIKTFKITGPPGTCFQGLGYGRPDDPVTKYSSLTSLTGKKIFMVFLVGVSLLLCATVVAQAAHGEMEWQNSYGGSDNDQGRSVLQTTDGGYIIAGTGDSIVNGSQVSQISLIKTNAEGAVMWQHYYGVGAQNDGYAVALTGDGGYVVVGTTSTISNGNQILLVKTDANGVVQWQSLYRGKGTAQGNSVQQTADGGYIIGGSTMSPGEDYMAFMVKTDASGAVVWQNSYGESNGSYYGNSVWQTSDGGYIMTGGVSFDSDAGLGGHLYLVKTSADGTMLWQENIGPTLQVNAGNSVQQTPDGGYVIVGTADYGGQSMLRGQYAPLLVVQMIKTSPNGSIEWQKYFGDSDMDMMDDVSIGYNEGYSVDLTADGGYIVAGATVPVINDQPPRYGSYQAYLVKTDAKGAIEWEKNYGGDGTEKGYSVEQTQDGSYILAGTSDSFGNGSQVYLIKVYSDSLPIPIASFESNFSGGMSPLTVQFNDTSSGLPTSWMWNFGDGTANVTIQNATHTFVKPGSYKVVLTAANGSLSSSTSGYIYIGSAQIIVDPRPGFGMFTSITRALAYASAGDKIIVDSGYYRESLVINKSVELAGQNTGRGLPVIDGSGGDAAIRILANGVSINGFGITGSNDGIFVAANTVNISNNRAYNNSVGIELYRIGYNKVSGNTVDNNSVGIELYNSSSNDISRNNARSDHMGIYLLDSSGNDVSFNKAGNNDRYGIYLSGSSVNSVSYNQAGNDTFYGIALGNSDKNDILYNTANNDFSGIYLWNSSNNFISENTVEQDSAGDYLYNSSDNRITSETANADHYGIILYGSKNNSVFDNTANANDHYGIYLYNSSNTSLTGNVAGDNKIGGIVLYGSDDNNMSNNIAHNDHYGIYLYDSGGNHLSWNTADANGYNGIILYRSDLNEVSGNTVNNNGYGIYLYDSRGNTLWSNSLLNNTRNAFVNGGANSWNTTTSTQYVYNGYMYTNYTGNYWGDYAGTDGNADGIGDTPYQIDANNKDFYPMMTVSRGVSA